MKLETRGTWDHARGLGFRELYARFAKIKKLHGRPGLYSGAASEILGTIPSIMVLDSLDHCSRGYLK